MDSSIFNRKNLADPAIPNNRCGPVPFCGQCIYDLIPLTSVSQPPELRLLIPDRKPTTDQRTDTTKVQLGKTMSVIRIA